MTADIGVSSVTYSIKLVPFLDAAWLKQGAFAAITNLTAPWQKEAALPNKLLSPELVTGEIRRAKPGQCKECIYILRAR